MKPIVGVMGAGRTLAAAERELALSIGSEIARHGWILLTGGSACGVMDAASEGAHRAGGLVIGVLKGKTAAEGSAHLDIAIKTGMGDARNIINVLTSDVVLALPGGSGTLSEVALGLKSGRTVIAVGWDPGEALRAAGPGTLLLAASAEEAIALVERELGAS